NCHPKATATYLKSPMGNSIAPPSPLAGGRITRQPSGTEISIADRDGHMIHSLSVNGLTAEYPIAYQIGAGKVGYSYLVRIRDYLFESPASLVPPAWLGRLARLSKQVERRFRPADRFRLPVLPR